MARLIMAGDGFVTDSERQAGDILAQLPTDWLVIANKILPASQGRSFEIDFIVIGDRLVFVIDAKHRRGRITGSDVLWVYEGGGSEKSPLNKVDYVAKVFAGYLRDRVATFINIGGHTVEGCVLITGASERPSLRDRRAASGVLLASDALDILRQRDASAGNPEVGRLRKQIEQTLVDLSHRPKLPKAINEYTIDESTLRRDGSYQFLATHPQGGQRLLTMHNVASADSEAKEFFLHEYRALAELRDTGVVPDCQDPFVWSDDFVVFASRLPEGVTLGSLPRPSSLESALEEVQRAAAAYQVLDRIHRAKVLHRALGPETISVSERDGAPRIMLTGFHAAKRGSRTISPRLDELDFDNPYAAPEIVFGYEFATASSDVYALALIFLERLSGVPIAQIERQDDVVRLPASNSAWSYLPESVLEEIKRFFTEALNPGPVASFKSKGTQRPSAEACAAWLNDIARQLRTDIDVDGQHLFDARYRIVRELGVGASARTFLVTDTLIGDLFAVKQYLQPSKIDETSEAQREFKLLSKFPHDNLPRVFDVYPSTNDIHIKLDFIEGPTLRDVLTRYHGELERCQSLAHDLLNAVAHLEQHHLLHRDIKPSNIILREGGDDAILIDFGAAAASGVRIPPAGTPGYLPPEAYFSDEPPPSMDRYAVAVVLFQALTGRLPFARPDDAFDPQPLTDLDGIDLAEAARPFAKALLRAVAADPSARYSTTEDFRLAIRSAGTMLSGDSETGLEEQINPTVDLLRGLFRNSTRGNADNRGLDSDFARTTYVPTALDRFLLPAILSDLPRAVFLSGNPGDGKTAFLEQIRDALRTRGGEAVTEDASGWEWTLDGRTYRACYDASESHAGKSADEQVRARLRGLEGDEPPDAPLTVLIAINDGRLADVLENFDEEFGWLVEEVERAYDPDQALEPGGVWLIDLKRRAFIGLRTDATDHSVMRRILATLVAPERWTICETCASHPVCPIRRNARHLGADGESVSAQRLEHLMLLSHLRGQRHMTIRDLRSGLAYLVTGDASCEDVHAARHGERTLPTAAYWQAAFATPSERDILLGEMAPLDPGRFARPRLERFLFFHRTASDAPSRAALFRDGDDVPPTDEPVEWLEQIKRRLYFESIDAEHEGDGVLSVEWSHLLPYRYATDFVAALAGELPLSTLLPRVARGIGRSDGLGGAILNQGLCLRVAHSDANRLTVLKQFALDQFTLTIQQPPSGTAIEALPEALELTHARSTGRLLITLDLFELLMRFADGLEATGPELQPLLEDLAPFKSAVQLSNAKDLILIEAGHRLHSLTQRDGKVVRTSLTEGAARR